MIFFDKRPDGIVMNAIVRADLDKEKIRRRAAALYFLLQEIANDEREDIDRNQLRGWRHGESYKYAVRVARR